ncbi:MAG TPA: hypothetical protein PLM79_12625 [Syntrophobacteraceae bacterium]|nr:hypothetical protein [Syntrophobacteraceae bacterium]
MWKHILIAGVVLVVGLMAVQSPKTEVRIEGRNISIDSGSHHLEGTLDPEATYLIFIKDEGSTVNTFSGDAFVTVLPLKTAEQLRAQFGDFFHCNSPGAGQAMRSMLSVILVSDLEAVKEKVSRAMSLVRKSQIPVVRFRGFRVHVTRQTYAKMEVVDHTGTTLFYLNDFEILKSNYLQ